jgi:chromosome segregation ATPase
MTTSASTLYEDKFFNVKKLIQDTQQSCLALDENIAVKNEIITNLENSNFELEVENRHLREELLKGYRETYDECKKLNYDNSSNSKVISRNIFEEKMSEIDEIKREKAKYEVTYKEKNKTFRLLKNRFKILNLKIKFLDTELDNIIDLKSMIVSNNKQSNEADTSGTDDDNIIRLKNKISDKIEQILKFSEDYTALEAEYNNNEKEYNKLSKCKFDLNFKIKKLQDHITAQTEQSKENEQEMEELQINLKKYKTIYERLETELNHSLYFIRFSNSLVRSFLNIINVRKLQIDMLKRLSKPDIHLYEFLFKKIDEYELTLVSEYKNYISLYLS